MAIGDFDTWELKPLPSSNDFTSGVTNVIQLASGRLVAVGSVVNISDDDGDTWQDRTPGNVDIDPAVGLIQTTSGRILVGVFSGSADHTIVYSDDDGDTWTGTGQFLVQTFLFLQLASGRIVAAGWEGWDPDALEAPAIAVSDDDGATWTSKGSTDQGDRWTTGIVFPDGRIFLAGESSNSHRRAVYSDGDGESWTIHAQAADGELFDSLSLMGSLYLESPGKAILVGSTFSKEQIESTDGGDTWVSVPSVSWDYAYLFKAHGFLFWVEYGGNIYRSADEGVSWTEIYGENAGELADDGGSTVSPGGGTSYGRQGTGTEDGRLVVPTNDNREILVADGDFSGPPPKFWQDLEGTREIRRA